MRRLRTIFACLPLSRRSVFAAIVAISVTLAVSALPPRELLHIQERVIHSQVSADGKILVTLDTFGFNSPDNEATLKVRTETGALLMQKVISVPRRHLAKPAMDKWSGDDLFQLSPDGSQIATVADKGDNVIVFDCRSGTVRHSYLRPEDAMYVRAAAYNADGRLILWRAGAKGGLHLQEAVTGTELLKVEGGNLLTRDGFLFDVHKDRIIIWNIRTGKLHKELGLNTSTPPSLSQIAISADGSTLAMFDGGMVTVWDLLKGEKVWATPIEQFLRGLMLSASGKRLAIEECQSSAPSRGRGFLDMLFGWLGLTRKLPEEAAVRIYDVNSGSCLGELDGYMRRFSPDGQTVVLSGMYGAKVFALRRPLPVCLAWGMTAGIVSWTMLRLTSKRRGKTTTSIPAAPAHTPPACSDSAASEK